MEVIVTPLNGRIQEVVLYSDAMAEIEKKDELFKEERERTVWLQKLLNETVDLVYARNKEIVELRKKIEVYQTLHKVVCKCEECGGDMVKRIHCEELKAKLSRLTAALNDDERVRQVSYRKGSSILGQSYRREAINDYRAEILKEAGI